MQPRCVVLDMCFRLLCQLLVSYYYMRLIFLFVQNAADLILTEPGLSPIYGAVLESRRIFSRIKAYVVYRVAASIILVLVLSTIIFASGCAVDSLLVIVLALLNDISMIPVAYDNASATTKPQLPNARKLVLQSLYYGVCHTAIALIFIFALDHAPALVNPIGLDSECDSETRGFIWFYLLLVTELAIFSVRAPSYFWLSRPSAILLVSVIGTCIGGAFIAVFASDLSPDNMGYIIACNVFAFCLVDVGKVHFRELVIHDIPGDIIETDELIKVVTPPLEKPETEKNMEKLMRYQVHRESMLSATDVAHSVEFRRNTVMSAFFDIGHSNISDGFTNNRYARTKALSTPVGGLSSRPDRAKSMSTPYSVAYM